MIAFMIFLVIVIIIEIIRHLYLEKMKFICTNPNCGFTGYAVNKEKGSLLMFLLLAFLGAIPYVYAIIEEKESVLLLIICVIPVSIYYIFKGGNYHICPKCGIKVCED
ncbi:MAG: hypothetical protein BWY74_00765 [Firmicutes bacterium ADurb.Bin419]|nr:MAG: hypothetical protein BWY74_00765 [Firmicutes bacterium ADurb.Bin419]